MKIGPLIPSHPLVLKSLVSLRTVRARLEPLCLRVWTVLNCNLVEGILLPERYLAICIERGGISAAAGERFFNRGRLTGSVRYAFEESEFPTPGDLVTAVSRAINELGHRGSRVLLGIPREWVVIRTAGLPSTVKENIGPVVGYEIDRLTPLTASDAMYDFIVGAEVGETLPIALMAVRKETLNPYVAALAEKGFPPGRISTPSVGMARLCCRLAGAETVVSLHVGMRGYEGWSVEKGNLTGNFYGSLGEYGEEEDPQGRYDEVRAILHTESAAAGSPLVCLLPENGSGVGDILPDTPHRVIKDSEIMSLFKTSPESAPLAPAAMLFEALSPGMRTFDLARGNAGGKRRASLITALVLATLLVMMVIPYVVVPIEIQKRRIDAIEGQIKARRKDVMEVEGLRKRVEALQGEIDEIEDFKIKRPMLLNVLKGLTSLLPKAAWLTRTRITEETVEIEGYAASATTVLSLLEESDLFRKVEFASPTVKDHRLNSERFVIRMELEGFRKEEAKKEGTVKKDEARK